MIPFPLTKFERKFLYVSVACVAVAIFCTIVLEYQRGEMERTHVSQQPASKPITFPAPLPKNSPFTDSMTIAEKKALVLKLVAGATRQPLTADQKLSIEREIGGSRTAQYGFTANQIKEIIAALNAH